MEFQARYVHYNHTILLWIIIETPLSISTYTFIVWNFLQFLIAEHNKPRSYFK